MTSKAFGDRLARRARRAGLIVPPRVVDALEAYIRLLAKWNLKVNLTSLPLDEPTDETFDRLLIEPLSSARMIEDSWSPWLDVGSGGGSPAIPLKLARPALALTMVESKTRKAAFLREIVRELGLEGVRVEARRFDELAAELPLATGMVTVRAVRVDPKLSRSIVATVRPAGRLLMFQPTPLAQRIDGFRHQTSTVLVVSRSRPAFLLIYERNEASMFHVEHDMG